MKLSKLVTRADRLEAMYQRLLALGDFDAHAPVIRELTECVLALYLDAIDEDDNP